jgi:CRP-like cAMP-binding protein
MATSTQTLGTNARIEDVLAHLPIANTTGYSQGQLIYGPDRFSKSLYLVISGKVLVSRIGEEGSEVVLEIVRPDELFGESAFLDLPHRSEQATALEEVMVMTWAISDMEGLVTKRPRLALALVQVLAQRTPSSAAGSKASQSTTSNGGSPVRWSVSPSVWASRRKMDR